VGLVDHEEPDPRPPQGEDELQGAQPLGGDVEHPDLARPNLPLDLPPLLRREAGVQGRRVRHGALQQGVDLVLHQGDEGRDDHREAPLHEGRDLVAQALPAARRHDRQRVPSFEHGPYHGLLPGTERIEPEDLLEYALRHGY
jgi:hypothetical protein